MKKIIIGILVLCVIGIIIYFAYIMLLFSAFGVFDKDYSVY